MTTPEITETPANTVARIISLIFHPLLMPLYGMLIIFSTPTLFGYLPFTVKKILFLIILINNIIVPLLLMPWFRYRNIITSWIVVDRKERRIPLIATSFFYCITVYIIVRYHIPLFIKYFVVASAGLSIAITILNFWSKISIHAAGSGALLAMIIILSFRMHTPLTWLMVSAILSSGLVMYSRLVLNAHTSAEVWSGFFLGFVFFSLVLLLF
jgi:membrane-associated phospholipid phosphatase